MKNKIRVLILFSIISLLALSAVQAFLIRNTYILEENVMLKEVKDLNSEIRRSMELDSLIKLWETNLMSIVSIHQKNQDSDSVLIQRIKERAEETHPLFTQIYEQKIKGKELGYELKHSSSIKNIILKSEGKLDTVYRSTPENPIQISGDYLENTKAALVVNTTRFSPQVKEIVMDKTIIPVDPYSEIVLKGNLDNQSSPEEIPEKIDRILDFERLSKNHLEFDAEWEDLIFVEEQRSILFGRMANLFFISIGIFLFVILLLFYSIKSLIAQKKIAEIKTDFVNNITHEFKTPLATLEVAVKSLENESVLNTPSFLENTVRIIKHQSHRLQRLVDEAMYNSLSSNAIVLHKEEVFDKDYFKQLLKDFQLSSNIPEVKLEIVLPSEKRILKIDTFHLTTALWNILENAVKYGDETTKISFTAYLKEGNYIIEIENTGSTINKKDKKYIFNKFYRVSSGSLHNVKGMGLGLHYAKQIAKAHGGDIFMRSKENSVCFTVKIPVR